MSKIVHHEPFVDEGSVHLPMTHNGNRFTPHVDDIDGLEDYARQLLNAAAEARAYRVSVAHQVAVNRPNPHAACEPAAPDVEPGNAPSPSEAVAAEASSTTPVGVAGSVAGEASTAAPRVPAEAPADKPKPKRSRARTTTTSKGSTKGKKE